MNPEATGLSTYPKSQLCESYEDSSIPPLKSNSLYPETLIVHLPEYILSSKLFFSFLKPGVPYLSPPRFSKGSRFLSKAIDWYTSVYIVLC